jgi:hypothetical protein
MNDHGFDGKLPVFYEAGLKTGIRDVFEIYVPLVVSSNIDSVSGTFRNRIRFIFSLESLIRLKPNSQGV